MRAKALPWVLFLILLLPCATSAEMSIPPLSGRVNDYAQVLTPEQSRILEQQLEDHEKATSDQVVVLTIKTLDGEDINEFANKVFRAWGLGQKERNNGVLFIAAIDNHKMRIEVGYGLEGALTDLESGRINKAVVPFFRREDYNGGITTAVTAIIAAIEGEYVAEISSSPEMSARVIWLIVGWIAVFFITICGSAVHPLAGGIVGGIGSFIMMLLGGFGIGACFWAAVIGFIVGFFLAFAEGGDFGSGIDVGGGGGGGFLGGGGSAGGGGNSMNW